MAPRLRPTVGLEIHVRLATGHKLFCGCAFRFGAEPNTLVCPVCLGLPGSLPVLDRAAVDLALRTGAALGCRSHPVSEFERKNYFYPDLPKNYQITQYARPLLTGGRLPLPGSKGQEVRLRRIHLEEDAGRTLAVPAPGGRTTSGDIRVDFNRAGTPLMEIVTEPDLSSGDEARDWLRLLLQTLEYLEVCDGNLAEGSLRCDVNVGLRGSGMDPEQGPWSEVKNLNSFRAVGKAVDHEIQRLRAEIRRGAVLRAQTRSWDPAGERTRFLRFKEKSRDYRYFPEPDLPPLVLAPGQLAAAAADLPELPPARQDRLSSHWALSAGDVRTICRTRILADYFEALAADLAARTGDEPGSGRLAATWTVGPLLHEAEDRGFARLAALVPPPVMAELLAMVQEKEITGKTARQVFHELAAGREKRSPQQIIREQGLGLIRDPVLIRSLCRQIMADNPQQVASVKQGRAKVLEFLVGQVLKQVSGRASPAVVRRCLVEEIQAK